MKPLCLLLALLLLASCQTKTQKVPAAPNTPMVSIPAGTASKAIEIHTNDADLPDPTPEGPPPFQPFDSSLGWRGNLDAGWIDSFKMQGHWFRLRSDWAHPPNDLVEKKQNGAWVKNTDFGIGDEYERTDLNGDGYDDMTTSYQSRKTVSFYDPGKGRFDTNLWTFPDDANEVLDAHHDLHIDWRDVYHERDKAISDLYTYKNGRPYYCYELVYEHNLDGSFRSLKLYRFTDGNYADAQYVRTVARKNDPQYRYGNFWRAHYKKLLGIDK